MNKYKASFLVSAEVLVELVVEAENQQDGLVFAHDAINAAKPEQGRVLRLSLDTAVNSAFERLEGLPAATPGIPPSPLALETGFKVSLYEKSRCTGAPVRTAEVPSFDAARNLAESVLRPGSAYGSSAVYDQLGTKVLEVRAKRGGWEVEVVSSPDNESTLYSWLDDTEAAKSTALQLLARKDTQFVRIWDFTDRGKGPVLWKEIR